MIQSLAYFTTTLYKHFAEFCNRELQKLGLSQGLLYFILYIGKHPGCSPKELADALHMDMGHTTRTIVKLVQGGFLRQALNPTDRRAHVLHLTDLGLTAFDTSHDLLHRWDEEILSPLSSSEQEQLFILMGRLGFDKEMNRNA